MEYLSAFHFVLKHKSRGRNQVPNALCQRHNLLQMLQTNVVGFEILKELYPNDAYF